MSKKPATTKNTTRPFQEMEVWQRELFEKLSRILAVVSLPVFVLGGRYIWVTQKAWAIPLLVLVYAVIAVVAFIPRIPYLWRVYGFLSAQLVLGAFDLLTYGWGEDGRIYLLGVTLFAAIFLGGRHSLIFLVASNIILFAFVVIDSTGILSAAISPTVSYPFETLLVGFAIYMVFSIGLFISFNYIFPRLLAALQKGVDLSHELEIERVRLSERTSTLQDANLNLQRRALYLESSTQVAQALATMVELDTLLDQAVNLIAGDFGFSHVAVFLMDDEEEWAVLRAASSSEGHRLLANQHRVRCGSDSMVGRVAHDSQPRIAIDPESMATSDLATARSEMTLPLMAGTQRIGVLDIQSTEEAAFDPDDMRVLQGLSGVLAAAISNAKRLGNEASVLEAASPLYRLARRLATARIEREIYTAILESLRGFSPAQVFIFRFEEGLPSAYLVAEMQNAELAFHDQRFWADDIRYIGEIVAFSRAIKSSMMIGDLKEYQSGQSDVDAVLARLAEEMGIFSLALTPLWVGPVLVGTLLVTYHASHYFTALQGQLYLVLADLAGRALERIWLLQQAQTHLESERWIREFGEAVMRIPDLATMVAQSAALLQDVSKADGVLVSLSASEQGSLEVPGE
ncbi:MAG: GAF domain-containing protein [Anaerolineae bacterium]|nr:GAF domain-containing protein [Anaerolineae bacterium]